MDLFGWEHNYQNGKESIIPNSIVTSNFSPTMTPSSGKSFQLKYPFLSEAFP